MKTIVLMSKDEIDITEDEYKKLAGKTGLVHLPSQDIVINMNSIAGIFDAEKRKEVRGNEGVLHDGLPVIKYFGIWYADDGHIDEKGKPLTKIDPTYYQEVARDQVPSRQEYQQKYAHLKSSERLKLMVGDKKETDNKTETLKQIAENKYKQ